MRTLILSFLEIKIFSLFRFIYHKLKSGTCQLIPTLSTFYFTYEKWEKWEKIKKKENEEQGKGHGGGSGSGLNNDGDGTSVQGKKTGKQR